MNKNAGTASAVLAEAEQTVAKQKRALQSTQTFTGSIRVRLESVFVDKKDGLRALAQLKSSSRKR
jgi:hypothetical protein